MKIETYSCNLCRDKKQKSELMCLAFDNQIWKPTIDLTKSDIHICTECIKVVKSIHT